MSHEKQPTGRRRFLVYSGVALLTGAGLSGSNTLVLPDMHAIALELTRLLQVRDEARWVGRTYLTNHPSGASPTVETLTRTLMEGMGYDIDHLTLLPLHSLKVSIIYKVHRDYDEEQITFVEEWLISETEARLCAILYLEERGVV